MLLRGNAYGALLYKKDRIQGAMARGKKAIWVMVFVVEIERDMRSYAGAWEREQESYSHPGKMNIA